jgi:hypothetical protein
MELARGRWCMRPVGGPAKQMWALRESSLRRVSAAAKGEGQGRGLADGAGSGCWCAARGVEVRLCVGGADADDAAAERSTHAIGLELVLRALVVVGLLCAGKGVMVARGGGCSAGGARGSRQGGPGGVRRCRSRGRTEGEGGRVARALTKKS